MVRTEVVDKVKEYVKILIRAGISVDKAFLFGSYAKGWANPESDIDVMIVSKDFDQKNDFLIGESWRLTAKVDSRIEPYLVGLKRFDTDDVSPILQVVKKEGLEITI